MKVLLIGFLVAMLMAQTKFHVRYFSTDPKSGISIHIQNVEEAGCVRMDNCGWMIRWDAGDRIRAKWDQVDFQVGYLDGTVKVDERTGTKSKPETLMPVFIQHPATVLYIHITLSNKSNVVGRAEFR